MGAFAKYVPKICTRSHDPIYIVTYYMKLVKTSCTNSNSFVLSFGRNVPGKTDPMDGVEGIAEKVMK